MFHLNRTCKFIKKAKKLIKGNPTLKSKIRNTFNLLCKNPFYPSLKSHKVKDKNANPAFSSRVTGDIRIIWNYQDGKANIIDIIDIGGHEGKNKVYN